MATTPPAGSSRTKRRNRYHVQKRPGKVYDATTGELRQAHVIVYQNDHDETHAPPYPIPGTWTRSTAAHIAKTLNNPKPPR